jgi:hypothetical protein
MSTQIVSNAQLDSLLRRGFSEAGARPKPETTMTQVIEALTTLGVTASVDDGLLILKRDNTVFHTGQCLRGFVARPEFAKFFVTEADDPRNWTNAMKMQFIKEFGADAWARKSNSTALAPTVKVLDVNMSKADYENLTRSERVQFIKEFGADAVSRIFIGKRK